MATHNSNGKFLDTSHSLGLFGSTIVEKAKHLFAELDALDEEAKIEVINQIRICLHQRSPFRDEPVDCVQWVRSDLVTANDYNPNTVAPPEMRLLEHSIAEDGYTQPIVGWANDDCYEVVDGFHRNRVGKESSKVRYRTRNYLPLSIINADRLERSDRIAATIRHNRARGKHRIEAMSDIVIELRRRNWTTERICRELGMDEDEVLRLCQITGLIEMFGDQEFSQAWDIEGEVADSDFTELTDDPEAFDEEDTRQFRTVNTGDENRIFHTHDKWECFQAGFYANTKDGMTKQEGEEAYRAFLADDQKFRNALDYITNHWKHSCEHYLTNTAMNRIAWLGQAAACHAIQVPAAYRSGFWLLTEQEQLRANETALEYLNRWLAGRGLDAVTMEVALATTRQTELY